MSTGRGPTDRPGKEGDGGTPLDASAPALSRHGLRTHWKAVVLVFVLTLTTCGLPLYLVQRYEQQLARDLETSPPWLVTNITLDLAESRRLLARCSLGEPMDLPKLHRHLDALRATTAVLRRVDPSHGDFTEADQQAWLEMSDGAQHILRRTEASAAGFTPLSCKQALDNAWVLFAHMKTGISEPGVRLLGFTGLLGEHLRALQVSILLLSVLLATTLAAVTLALRVQSTRSRELAASRNDLQNVIKTRDHFLGMVSHELLSPIQVMISSQDVIESRGRVDTSDPTWQRLCLAMRSLNAQVGDLVDFARLAAGRMEIRKQRFKPRVVIETVLDEYEGKLIEKDLDVAWVPDPTLNHFVVSDPKRVRQILTNLYSNAIKYTPKGTITIDARVDEPRSVLCLQVTDTGLGMRPEQIETIFQPYVRLDQERESAEGTGIGLSVVKSLVHAMQGRITVDSKPGLGSTFTVELPVDRQLPHAPVVEAATQRILLVDDDEPIRTGFGQLLRARGFEADEAATVAEAQRKLAAAQYAVALLDKNLPDGSGVTLARSIRSGQDAGRTRILMMTANPDLTPDERALMDVILPKPVSQAQLMQSLVYRPDRPPPSAG